MFKKVPHKALLKAIRKNDLEKVKTLLLQADLDINARDNNGWNALERASSFGCVDILKLLIKAGADVNAQDKNGKTALYVATYHGNFKCVEALINEDADVDLGKSYDGDTALITAVRKRRKKCLKLLIEAGANINATNNRPSTGLIIAAYNGYFNCAQLLVEAGPDLTIRHQDSTALDYACKHNHTAIIKLLKAAEAKAKQTAPPVIDVGAYNFVAPDIVTKTIGEITSGTPLSDVFNFEAQTVMPLVGDTPGHIVSFTDFVRVQKNGEAEILAAYNWLEKHENGAPKYPFKRVVPFPKKEPLCTPAKSTSK